MQKSENNFVRFFCSNENKKISYRNLLTFKSPCCHFVIEIKDAHGHGLAPFLGDLSQIGTLSEMKPPLVCTVCPNETLNFKRMSWNDFRLDNCF